MSYDGRIQLFLTVVSTKLLLRLRLGLCWLGIGSQMGPGGIRGPKQISRGISWSSGVVEIGM